MAAIDRIRRELKRSYRRLKKHGGWRAVGDVHGITGGMAYKIAVYGQEPKDPHIRLVLGLPAMAPAPVCERCGVVHVRRRCPAARRARRWRDLPVDVLRAAIETRSDFDMPPELRDMVSSPRVKRQRADNEL